MHESSFRFGGRALLLWGRAGAAVDQKNRRQCRREQRVTRSLGSASNGLVCQAFVIADGFGFEEFLPLRGDTFVGEDVADVLEVCEFGKGHAAKAGVIGQ